MEQNQVTDRNLSIRVVRRNCLDCSGGSPKYVTWCPCDGLNSTRCEFWLFRFGVQPGTFRERYGARLLTPQLMPPASVDLDELPATLVEAATAAIDLPEYRQPAVELPKRPSMSPKEREHLRARLTRGLKQPREAEIALPEQGQNPR